MILLKGTEAVHPISLLKGVIPVINVSIVSRFRILWIFLLKYGTTLSESLYAGGQPKDSVGSPETSGKSKQTNEKAYKSLKKVTE